MARYEDIGKRTRLLIDAAMCAVQSGLRDDVLSADPLEVTTLEQRILMSASPMAALADCPMPAETPPEESVVTPADTIETEQPAGQSQETNQTAPVETVAIELVVIDPSAEDHERLVADLQAQQDRHFEILVLNPREDGIAQISEALQEIGQVSALHLVSHGEEGEILLGTSVLSQRTLDRHLGELMMWQNFLTADADLLIYGCDLAASDEGVALTESLNMLIGADVAASNDDTGHAAVGGDWEFEHQIGTIETQVAFTAELQENWSHLLNVSVDATSTGTTPPGQIQEIIEHTTSGTDRLILVAISFGQNNGESVASVTYGGENLTLVGVQENADGNSARVEIWSLTAPSTGTADVIVNYTGGAHDGAVVGVTTFNGVDQAAALRSFTGAEGNGNDPSVTTTSQADDLVFAAVALEDQANVQFAPGSGQTEQFDLRVASANGAGSVQAGASGASTFSANRGGPFAIAAVAVRSSSEFTEVSEFRVNDSVDHVQETSANSRGSHRAVGIADDGSYVIVYSDSGSDGDGFGIFARQFNADGSPRSAAFQVNVDSFSNQRWATVAVDASGRFVVAWTSQGQDGDGQGIYLRRFNADGTAIDANDIRVNSATAHNQINPSVAINDSGQIVVAWQGDANNDGIYAKRFDLTAAAPGNVVPGAEIVVDTGNNRRNPSVDINNDGKFVVVWERDRKPHAQRFDADGTPRGPQIDINPLNFFGREVTPSVIVHDDTATTASGDFVVTYRSEIGGFQGVWFKRYLDDGSSLGVAEKASTGNSHTSPSIAKGGDGSFIIVYEGDGDGDGQGVFARKYSGDGTAQGSQFQVNQTSAADQQYASVALLDLNNFVVVWSGNGTQNGQEDGEGVFARQFGTAPANSAPVADAGPAAITIREGETLRLDASGSVDADGDDLIYEWDFSYDGVTFFPSLTVTSPTVDIPWDELSTLYGIDDDGTWEIALRVSDGSQTSSVVVQTLTVVNTPPTIVVTGDSQVGVGETFTLNLATSDPGNDTIAAWHIDWGDGTIETIPGTATTATHVFANGGFTQNITVSVTDEDGTHHASQLVATSFVNDSLYLNSDNAETTTSAGDGPFDIEQGPDGLLYVSNFNSDSIDRFDPVTGDLVDRFVFSNSGGLLRPSRIAFGPDQSLFVASMGTDEVLRFGNDGRPLGAIVTGINEPDAIAFDGDGTLYVSSQTTGDIFRFDAQTGAPIDAGPFVSFGQTTFIDLNFGPNGNLFASSTVDNVIREFDTDGNVVGDFGGGPLTEIDAAGGFTRSANGDLYVTDFTGTTIARYDSTGVFVETLGTDLSSPFSVLFTASHQVRINDTPTVTGETYTVAEGGTLLEPVVADWFNINWKARQEILLDNSASSTDLTDFAVLVTLHETDPAAINIDYDRTRDAGEDLRFVDPDGSLLDYEIESWDESGYSYVWVRVPQLDAGPTTDSFFLYYDNDQASDGHSEDPVWSPDFALVQHNNRGGNDSSGNNNNGSVVDVSAAPGIVAGAASFNGATSRIVVPASPSIDNTFAGGGTISAWINPEGYGESNHGRILDKANTTFGPNGDGWALQVSSNGNLRFEHGFTGSFGAWVTEPGSISLNEWQQVVVVYDTDSAGNDPRIYINGVEQTVTEVRTPSGTVRSDAGIDLTQGNFSGGPIRTFDGLIDEVRVRQSAASADEIHADYLTVTGAQTTTNGAAETNPGGLLANDSDREGNNLTVSLVTGPAHAASFTLNPDGSFEYVHDGSDTTSDSFTYTVTDGFSVSEPVTATLSITPVNDAPVLSSIADVTTPEDTAVGPIAFTVQDSDTAVSSLIVNATSSDQSLIADADIIVSGSGTDRTLSLTPRANVSGGPVSITVTVSDGTNVTQETFAVTIQPANNAPTISAIADVSVPQDTPVGPVTFTVTDIDATGSLMVTATSSDENIVADSSIVLSGTGPDRTLNLTPQPDASGTVTIGLMVSDGDLSTETEFNVTFTPGNQSPVISSVDTVTIDEDTASDTIEVEVRDADSPNGSLILTATSSDQSLIRDDGITISGGGRNRRLVIQPRQNAFGTATITLSVTDGELVTTTTFDVVVNPVNDSPEFAPGTDHSLVVSDSSGITVRAPGLLAGVTDAEGDPITVQIVDQPENGTLIVGPDGAFSYQADIGFFGQDTFSFLVTDGQDESDVSRFILEVPIVVPQPNGSATNPDDSTASADDDSSDRSTTTDEDSQNDSGDLPDVLTPQMDPTALQTDKDADEDDDRVLIAPPDSREDDDDTAALSFLASQVTGDTEDTEFTSEIRISTADSDRVSASALDLTNSGTALDVDLASLGVNRDAGAALLVRPSVQHFAELRATAEQIDALNEDLASSGGIQRITADAVKVGSTGLVIGTVFATLRGGMLFLGLLSQLPVWTFFDPLMVMDGVSGGDEGDSLQDIVDKQTQQSEQNSSSNHVR